MDGQGRYGINNRNSISIEICVNYDADYKKAVASAIELTKHLMTTLDIPHDKVVRHYDASRKWCPASMGANNWARWKKFKQSLSSDIVSHERQLQENLYKLGYRDIIIDGIKGPQTTAYLKDFQLVMNLNADGIMGPNTKAKMDEITGDKEMITIYKSVNILNQTTLQNGTPIIIDRIEWIKNAQKNNGIYWFLRKVAEYVE